MGCLANPVAGKSLAKLYICANKFAELDARLLLKQETRCVKKPVIAVAEQV